MIGLNEYMKDRTAKIVLTVSGVLGDLEDAGLIERGHPVLVARLTSGRGVSAYDQIRASGFRPSREEVEACLVTLERATGEGFPPEVVDLIVKWDDVKEHLIKTRGEVL